MRYDLDVLKQVDQYLSALKVYVDSLNGYYGLTNKQVEVVKMAIAEKLSKLSKMWKKTKPITPAFSTTPDGDYVAKLNEMKLGEGKKNGRLQVVSTFEIVDGEHEGNNCLRFDGVDEEQSMGYFKGYAEVIGFDVPEEIEMLQEAMDEFVTQNTDLFNIRLKMGNSNYQNLYVTGVSEYTLGEGEEGTESEEETAEEVEVETEEPEEVEMEEEVVEQEVKPVRKVISKQVVKTTKISKPVVKRK